MPSFRDLVDRRVPQYFVLYLGGGWGVIQFLDFLERFGLSPAWTNLAMLTWALLLPSVLLYNYNHGRPGRDAWTRLEKVAIPLNLILAVTVLGTAFGGADLGATMTKVTITDEDGNEITRTVARAEHRKRLALFAFDAEESDTAAAWMREGAMIALGTDLSQDIFIDMRVPAQFRKQLRDAGLGHGHNIPVALKAKIAQELHLPYFVSGRVSTGPEGVTLRAQLIESATQAVVGERVVTRPDIYSAVDEMSVLLRQDLELPAARPQGAKDLPVASFLSENVAAYRALVDGQVAAGNDQWPAAEQAFARASEMDPTFSLAQFALYQSRALQGNAQGAMPALEQAMKQLARMPERTTFLVKAEYFIMKQDMSRALSVVTQMTTMFPDDISGHAMRAQLQVYVSDFEGAIASLKEAMRLDPNQREMMLQIGSMQEKLGRFDEALQVYQDYAKESPNDVNAVLRVARTQQRLGNMSDAQATIERATLIDPTAAAPTVEMAMLERSTGNFDNAVRRLQAALPAASSADDSLSIYNALATVYEFSGQMKLAIETSQRAISVAARVQLPVQVLSRQMQSLTSYVQAGRAAEARTILAGVRSRMSPPFDEMWRSGQLVMALEQRDSVALQEARAGVQRIIDGFGFQILKPDVARADAMLLELRGDWAGALTKYEELQKLDPSAINVRRDMARVYRNLNRLDDAQRAVDDHLRVVPASPESHMELARIKLARGDKAGAQQALQRVAQVWAKADASFTLAAEMRQLQQAAQ